MLVHSNGAPYHAGGITPWIPLPQERGDQQLDRRQLAADPYASV